MKILFISHTNPRIHRRTAYSILSCLHIHRGKLPCPLELATDAPDDFSPFGNLIDIHSLSTSQIASWIERAGGYRNVVKAELFQDSFLFMDSDTVLLKPLQPLFRLITPRTSVMQCREYRLGKRPDFASLVADPDFPEFTAKTRMYNSGLLGVHRDNLPVIHQVLERVLAMRARHSVRTPEQLVDGTLLSQVSEIRTAPRWIYHYWQGTGFADAFMDRQFREIGLPEMIRRTLAGEGAPLFALGFRKNPFLCSLYTKLQARLERYFPNF